MVKKLVLLIGACIFLVSIVGCGGSTTATDTPASPLTLAQLKAQYRRDIDVRDLARSAERYKDWKLYYEGEVLTIYDDDKATVLQVMVSYPGAGPLDFKTIVVRTEVYTSGFYEGDQVRVWGRPVESMEFQNMLGGTVTQPLLIGDFVEKV